MQWPLPLLPLLLVAGGAVEPPPRWLVSAYLGSIHTVPADLVIEQPQLGTELSFPDVPFESRSYDPPLYYGYRVAGRVPGTRWLYVEAELIHGKIFAKGAESPPGDGRHRGRDVSAIPFDSVVQAFGVSHGMNFLLANAVLRIPIGSSGRWRFAARAGAGPMIPHPEIEIDGERTERYELGGVGAQLSAAVERDLWRNLLAIVEYKWTRADMTLSVHTGTARLTAYSHHAVFGLGFHF